MATIYAQMPEIKKVVEALKEKFSDKLGHVKPDKILYFSFSKPKSTIKGRIGPVPKRFAHLFPDQDYFLEIHKESWQDGPEGDRLYTILHELLHIPQEGFIVDSKEYRRTVKHDIQDFAELLSDYGIHGENVEKLARVVKK
jgi:predicted metallopeptidase